MPESDVDNAVLACRSTVLALRARDLSGEDVEGAQRAVEAQEGETWTSDEVWARELVLLEQMCQEEPEVPAEVQLVQIGPAAIVSTPSEYFCQFGLNIKAKSPYKTTMVVELANGCVGYVPDAQAVRDQSGYEPRTARSSKLAPEAGEELADAAVALLRA